LEDCPYGRGARGLTLLWAMRDKNGKKKSPDLNPVPWLVTKEVKEQRVNLFSPCLLIPECLDLKAPIYAPDQASGRTWQI